MRPSHLQRLAPIVAIVLALAAKGASGELACKDEDGNSVDWFIGYKFPTISGDKLFGRGKAYSFIASTNLNDDHPGEADANSGAGEEFQGFFLRLRDLLINHVARANSKASSKSRVADEAKWIASDKAIDDEDSVMMRTLAYAFDEELGANVSSVFYNDDPSGTTGFDGGEISDDGSGDKLTRNRRVAPAQNSRRAHAKGVLLMDDTSNTGLWITHSIPKFPTIRDIPLRYPASGTKNGQTFMCVTFDVNKTGGKIVNHLVNMRPLVYDNRISDRMYQRIPALRDLDIEDNMKHRRIKSFPKLSQTIKTRAGHKLKLFAKSISFNQDVYSGWIDEEIGSDLYVETWRNGQGNPLDSSCPSNDYHINNVQDLGYDKKRSWSYLKDHSKWAISVKPEVATVCIGDSNRMESQFKRGGGAVCIRCPTCWKIFDNTIQDVEPCPGRRSSG